MWVYRGGESDPGDHALAGDVGLVFLLHDPSCLRHIADVAHHGPLFVSNRAVIVSECEHGADSVLESLVEVVLFRSLDMALELGHERLSLCADLGAVHDLDLE